MNDKTAIGIHWSFWVISTVFLIWNIMGVVNFLVQMDPEMLNTYRESERMIIEGRPVWATAGFAVGVFAGAIGCLLLLFRKVAAYPVFIVSLAGVIVTMIHTLGIGIDFSIGEILGIIVMPVAVAIFLIWYAKLSVRRGWIQESGRMNR